MMMDVGNGWRSLLLVLGVSMAFLYLVESSGHKQKFGENCSRNKKCDFTKWLRCKQGKCGCFNPNKEKEELYYDDEQQRCVGRSGTNCSQKFYPFDDEETAHFFHMRGPTTNHWRYGNGSLRCGAHAFCDVDDGSYSCKCRQDYYEADDGKCYRLKGYGDQCVTNRECDPYSFLTCDTTECGCTLGGRLYDVHSMKCVVLAGMPCEKRVNRLDKRIVVDDCGTNALCQDDVCRCQFGMQIHSNRTCQRGYGQPCDADNPCGDSKLSCRNKRCQCKYPLHMRYEEAQGQCVGLASGPCAYNDTSELAIQCTRHAECVQNGLFSECKCKAGYLQTAEGECVEVYGSPCDIDLDCDRLSPLACINSHCECPDYLLSYDTKSRKCKGLVGSRCKISDKFCVDHASCIKFEEVAGAEIGRCLCEKGYKETTNRTCSHK